MGIEAALNWDHLEIQEFEADHSKNFRKHSFWGVLKLIFITFSWTIVFPYQTGIVSYGSPRLPRSHRWRSINQGHTPLVAWLMSSGTHFWCKIFSRLIFEAFMPQWPKMEAASLLHTLRLLKPQIFRKCSFYKGQLLRFYSHFTGSIS